MEKYEHKLRDHRDNLDRIARRSYDAAWEASRSGFTTSYDQAKATWHADENARKVASHYFHVIRYGA